jgi:hypothetical protein
MHNKIIIEAGRSERHYWLDLWRYRELFRVLAWRDLAVRYKQTVIGVVRALIRPFLTMVVLTVIFGRIAKLPSDGAAPYALTVLAGILPWTFFSTGPDSELVVELTKMWERLLKIAPIFLDDDFFEKGGGGDANACRAGETDRPNCTRFAPLRGHDNPPAGANIVRRRRFAGQASCPVHGRGSSGRTSPSLSPTLMAWATSQSYVLPLKRWPQIDCH